MRIMIPALPLDETLFPVSIHLCKAETINESGQSAPSQVIATALRQRQHPVVDDHTNELFLAISVTASALHFLEVRSSSKRHRPRSTVPVGLTNGFDGRIAQRSRTVVEIQCGENARHVIVVAEVSVQPPPERKGGRTVIKRMICARVVVHRLVRHPGNKLVREAYTLSWAQRVAIRKSVVLAQGLIIIILVPLSVGEERAEMRHRAYGRSNGIERAEIHHADCVALSQVGTNESSIQSGLYWRYKDACPNRLRIIRDVGVRSILKLGTEIVVQSVV